MVRRKPDMPGFVFVSLHWLHAVVPDAQHAPQPVPRPDAVSGSDVLDGARAAFGADERAFPDARVATGPEAFDVFRGVRSEQFGLAAVGPADDGSAGGLDEAGAGVGVADAAGAFVHGGDAVAEGGGDDGDPVGYGAGEAGWSVDVLADVFGAGLRLSGATPGHQEPAHPVAFGWDLVGLGLPAGFHLGTEEGGGACRDLGPVLGAHGRIVGRVAARRFRRGVLSFSPTLGVRQGPLSPH